MEMFLLRLLPRLCFCKRSLISYATIYIESRAGNPEKRKEIIMKVNRKKTEHSGPVRCLSRISTVLEMIWVVVNLAWLAMLAKEYIDRKNV